MQSQEQYGMNNDEETDMDKSDILCGRKRTFKNTKRGNSNSIKKSNNHGKESDQLIVPESIQNFKSQSITQTDDMSHKVS